MRSSFSGDKSIIYFRDKNLCLVQGFGVLYLCVSLDVEMIIILSAVDLLGR